MVKMAFFHFAERLFIEGNGTDRKSVAKSFSHGNNVRSNTVMHISEPFTGTSHAGCNLIDLNKTAILMNPVHNKTYQGFRRKFDHAGRASGFEHKPGDFFKGNA